jgi:electron transfer flavoprotein beta subunit
VDIVVCVKQTPEASTEKRLTPQMRLDRAGAERVINAYDEVALEEALRTQEKHPGSTVTALSMGPPFAEEALRKALAMGADRAVLVTDPALEGSDIWSTGLVLAAVLSRLSPDLVFLGMQSDDASSGLLAGALAERLGLAQLTQTAELSVEGTTVHTHRRRPDGYVALEAQLPVLIGVTDVINTPRYPSIKGIMAAKRKELLTWTLADLGLSPADVGEEGAHTRVVRAVAPPPRGKGEVFSADDDTPRRIADFLAARKLI